MKLDASTPVLIAGSLQGYAGAIARDLARTNAPIAVIGEDTTGDEAKIKVLSAPLTDGAAVLAAVEEARRDHGQERVFIWAAETPVALRLLGIAPETFSKRTAEAVEAAVGSAARLLCASVNGMVGLEPLGGDRERGVIVLTTSVAGSDGQVGQVAFAAASAALSGLLLPTAREVSDKDIRVVGIELGFFEVPPFRGAPDAVRSALGRQVLFPKRFGALREVAMLARQIIENPYLNATVLRLDGGLRQSSG